MTALDSAKRRFLTPDQYLTLLSLVVAGTSFMENLDGSIIVTALPAMSHSFHVPPIDLNIGVSAYLMTLGIFIPVSGWIADRFGIRRVFTLAIAIFTLGSGLCGLSNGLVEFVLLRIMQGIGGAMMIPVGRLAVLRNLPKEKLIKTMATLIWPALAAPLLGPALGGLIVTHASWRWIFYLNLPLGLIAIVAALLLAPKSSEADAPPFDWPGFLLTSFALFFLMAAIEMAAQPDPHFSFIGLLVVAGIGLLIAGYRHLGRTAYPMINLETLKIQSFSVSILGGSIFRITVSATPFLLPLMFQIGFGFSPFLSGALLAAIFAGNLLMKPFTTFFIQRFGFRRILIWNNVLCSLTILASVFLSPHSQWMIIIVLFASGILRSLQFTSLITLAYSEVPKKLMSTANTLFSTLIQISLGLGVTVGAISLRFSHGLVNWFHLGNEPDLPFRIALFIVTLISCLALIDTVKLSPMAGNLLRKKPLQPKEKTA
ncbi:MFS transporter [Zymomonas mobilis]|uniref:Major facilitator superfamily MFS_1 n=1 Tax=Zymomonas mobilis subsp. pomaceae (strain ATCC 29192 / DSM 22645 / JCM 10191 / CCUG 17912 / NBRC 13757 / NCIMB 11200 / NRRL B-4491 / Barker I) TaxID=579138 RepID=F8ETX4_ZYMMT|nr:MFS transporter [Zymomonas mobilis]AEI38071.1 major facilitator superfamily MFS_1 [Zymomonas mobilis subsp. pomaceae ATCC 29192]MDX5949438.1 MFS transporter [Zymomonas mobilis subsp. pomaceae]GEB89181.1 MFS transporter [Zymomonas mobilis subsp. pomaceae]